MRGQLNGPPRARCFPDGKLSPKFPNLVAQTTLIKYLPSRRAAVCVGVRRASRVCAREEEEDEDEEEEEEEERANSRIGDIIPV